MLVLCMLFFVHFSANINVMDGTFIVIHFQAHAHSHQAIFSSFFSSVFSLVGIDRVHTFPFWLFLSVPLSWSRSDRCIRWYKRTLFKSQMNAILRYRIWAAARLLFYLFAFLSFTLSIDHLCAHKLKLTLMFRYIYLHIITQFERCSGFSLSFYNCCCYCYLLASLSISFSILQSTYIHTHTLTGVFDRWVKLRHQMKSLLVPIETYH